MKFYEIIYCHIVPFVVVVFLFFLKHPDGVLLFCKHAIARKEPKLRSNAIDHLLLESKSMIKIFQHFLKTLLTSTF